MQINVYFVGVILSVVTYLVVGLLAGKLVKGVEDYYVSGRRATTLLITGTLFASSLSSTGFTGDQGWVYSGAFTTMTLIDAFSAAGMALGPILFGRYLRRSECLTMPQYFEKRYSDPGLRRIGGIVMTISVTAYLVSCMSSISLLMHELTGLNTVLCLVITWLCFTLFTFYSGSQGVILTDTMMFLVFVIGTMIGGYYVYVRQGGIGQLLQNLMNNPALAEGALDWHGSIAATGASDVYGSIMYAVTVGAVWLITLTVAPWQSGRFMMAKSEHVAFRSAAIGSAFMILFLMYLDGSSFAALNINASLDKPETVLIWCAMNVMPKLIGVLLLAGIMAAGLSSASTFLSILGCTITADVLMLGSGDDKKMLKTTRIVTLAVGLVAFVLSAIGVGGIRIVAIFASTVLAASWAVPCIGGMLTEKLSAKGARMSMMAGLIGFLIPKLLVVFVGGVFQALFQNFLDPFFVGLYCNIIFAVIGSVIAPSGSSERANYHELKKIPVSERSLKEYKRDKVYAWIMIASGIATTLILLIVWALPYNGWSFV